MTNEYTTSQIIRGLAALLVLSLLGFGYLLWQTRGESLYQSAMEFDLAFLMPLGMLTLLDLLLGGLRNHVFIRKIAPATGYWVSFRANLANMFFGAVTPAQTGGGFGQLFVFHRAGVPLSGAIATGVFNYLATLCFFMVSATLILKYGLSGVGFSISMRVIVGACVLLVGILLAFFLTVIVSPHLPERLLHTLRSGLKSDKSPIRARLVAAVEKLQAGVLNYRQHTLFFLNEARQSLWLSLLLTVLLYWNKYNIAYVVLVALKQPCEYLAVIFLQNVQLFLLYFAPTPGASGVAEASTVALMQSQVTASALPVFVLVWRFFTLHLAVVIGGMLLWREFMQKSPAGEISEAPVAVESQ